MANALGPLAFWSGYEGELGTLAIYAVGLGLYALVVGLFYRTLSHRNLIRKNPWTERAPGPVKFLVMFPLLSFGLFLLLSLSLFFLAKDLTLQGVPESRRVQDLLLISMALVAGVRVAAYIHETAAEDLAKLVPLGLVGVFLIDPGFLTLQQPLERIGMLPALAGLIARYFVVLVALEGLLRFSWLVTGGPVRERIREARAREAARMQAQPLYAPEPTPVAVWPPSGGVR